MGFVTILILVLIALIVLSILFAVFKFFIGLLPIALIVALIIWLITRFSSNNTESLGDFNTDGEVKHPSSNTPPRKKARNVSVKDVENDKEDNKNG